MSGRDVFLNRAAHACGEFYAGASHSEHLQSRLNTMQGWNAKQLASALPAWAKPTKLPAQFKPQLSQKFPAWMCRPTTCQCTRTLANFDGLSSLIDDPTAYIARWNDNNRLKG